MALTTSSVSCGTRRWWALRDAAFLCFGRAHIQAILRPQLGVLSPLPYNMSSPINMILDTVVWTPCEPAAECRTDDSIPYATHTGQLDLGGIILDVVQLSDGHRVITEDSLVASGLFSSE